MIVYRITLPTYANDLNGTGSALFGGRWNSIGNSLLYTAETSSLSILEHLVHIYGAESIQYILSKIEVTSSVKTLDEIEIELRKDWKSDTKYTSQIGDKWIKDKYSSVLKVPSSINPLEHNFLINPRHPDLQIKTINQDWFVYDRRLVRE